VLNRGRTCATQPRAPRRGYARPGDEIVKGVELVAKGASWNRWLSLPEGTRRVVVIAGLGKRSRLGVESITIEYRYKVLSTKGP